MKTQERFFDIVIYGVVAAMILFFVFSCDKKDDGNGNILAHVQYNGKAIDQPMIYIKLGSPASTTNYDYSQSGDAVGEAYFRNLKPGTYYIYGRGYSSSTKSYLSGTSNVQITFRSRQNDYKIVIETQ